MRKAIWYLAVAAVGSGAAGWTWAARSSGAAVERAVPSEARIRDLDIEFYRQRVERDPRSARDLAQLAGLYLQRARGTGDNAELLRAEQTARRSLALRTGRNTGAFGVLASSLLAQHRFVEALAVAQQLVAEDSTSVAARGLLGETQYELGRYGEAARTLGSLTTYRGDLGVAPRLARWEELHGRPEAARRLLRQARDAAKRQHAVPKEQRAWFQLRLGDLALRTGHLAEAERELREGLRIAPEDHRLLGTMARLELVRHRWGPAIAAGERAIAHALDPATLGVVGDAYAAMGDHAKASEYHHAMEVAVVHQPGALHRAWSLFLLDHNREIPTVLAKAKEELEFRRDIYGYDLLAWALHRSGRNREARDAMTHALALGTRDAVLFYHAGMIARALRDTATVRAQLSAALAANPFWHPFQPAEARAVLDTLTRR